MNGHISLYLEITETGELPLGWEVNASFKLFVFDQIRDEYLTVQEFKLRIRDQIKGEHKENRGEVWFSSPEKAGF
nr:hypothetical protein CFP56_43012 [Quercus suber]